MPVATSQTLPRQVQALLDPEVYPERPASVEFVQTHISYVFLAGASVYKFKKPVNFGFLDYSTPERRRACCEAEVALNRRLSPDIYLGVVPLCEQAGRLRLGGRGKAIDWAVQMRRLPADRNLEILIGNSEVAPGTGACLGEVVGRFHLAAARSPHITAIGGQATVEANWKENFEQSRPFRGRTLPPATDDAIQAYVAGFLEREAPLLAGRDAGGFIRDLHGDLRSAQIWVLDRPVEAQAANVVEPGEGRAVDAGIRILDCIEFNERLRCCDTASDAAFLVMDFAFRRRQDLVDDFLGRYLEVSGDRQLPLLLDFYCCYRAYVRGKVDSLALTELEIDADERRRLARRARRFFRHAASYATRSRPPRLICMMGGSGSGKSYLARLLATRLGAVIVASDDTRKRLAGLPPTAHGGPGLYSEEQTRRTYVTMLEAAGEELRRGHPVILDATFLRVSQRAPVIQLARESSISLAVIWCEADLDLIEGRMVRRVTDSWEISDADVTVARNQRARLEPPSELASGHVLRLDTALEVRSNLQRIEYWLARLENQRG